MGTQHRGYQRASDIAKVANVSPDLIARQPHQATGKSAAESVADHQARWDAAKRRQAAERGRMIPLAGRKVTSTPALSASRYQRTIAQGVTSTRSAPRDEREARVAPKPKPAVPQRTRRYLENPTDVCKHDMLVITCQLCNGAA